MRDENGNDNRKKNEPGIVNADHSVGLGSRWADLGRRSHIGRAAPRLSPFWVKKSEAASRLS
jgi:hypothetical protein